MRFPADTSSAAHRNVSRCVIVGTGVMLYRFLQPML